MKPKYTGTKEQKLAICRKAKTYVWDGKGSYWAMPTSKKKFVCHALSMACRVLHDYYGRPPELDAMVRKHINGKVSMEDFLSVKFGLAKVKKAGQENVQNWRQLMLDSMIKMIEEGKA